MTKQLCTLQQRLQLVIAIGLLLISGVLPAAEPVQSISMTLGDYTFSPDHLEVNAGTPVALTLTNIDSITPHNFILQDETGGLDIDIDIRAGKSTTIEFTPDVAGNYTFHCSKKLLFMKSHQEKGMHGTLIVK